MCESTRSWVKMNVHRIILAFQYLSTVRPKTYTFCQTHSASVFGKVTSKVTRVTTSEGTLCPGYPLNASAGNTPRAPELVKHLKIKFFLGCLSGGSVALYALFL